LNNVIKKYKEIIKHKSLPGQYSKETGYFKFLNNISRKVNVSTKSVNELITEFVNSGQSSIAVKMLFIYADYLLNKKSYEDVIDLITNGNTNY
jgi:hypothetical protein